jgi:hypothetical protein
LKKYFSFDDFSAALSAAREMGQSVMLREKIRNHWHEIAFSETNYAAFTRLILGLCKNEQQ